MVKVYATALSIGFLAMIVVIMGGAFADNVRREDRDPNGRLGSNGRTALGALLGFGIGGMAAEFSPLDFDWPVALVIAVIASGMGAAWVRYAARAAGGR